MATGAECAFFGEMRGNLFIPVWKMHTVLRIAALGLCFALCGVAQAQRLPFFNLSIEDGLAQSQTTCLAQDRWGRLWVGTLGGLSVYDGAQFATFSTRDGLPSGTITCLAAHPDGRVWVGTARGLVVWKNGRFSPVELPAPPMQLAVEGVSRRVVCLAKNRVYRVDSSAVQDLRLDSVLCIAGDSIFNLLITRAGSPPALIVHNGKPRGAEGKFVLTGAGNFRPSRIFRTRAGALLLSSQGALQRVLFKDSSGRFPAEVFRASPYHGTAITCAAGARDGSFWLGTPSGALHVTDTGVRRLRRREGLTDNRIFDVFTDREGHVWFASDGQGLFRFSGAAFQMLDAGAGLPSEQVMSIATDGRGTLYLGTYDAGLAAAADGVVKSIPFPGGESPAVTALAWVPPDALYIGTRGAGFWCWAGGRMSRVAVPGVGLRASATALYYAPQARTLYAAFGEGLVTLRGGAATAPVATGAAVNDLLLLPADTLLIATTGGLKFLLPGSKEPDTYRTRTLLDSVVPQCLLSTPEALWVGTTDHGVLRRDLRTGRVTTIDARAGLRSAFVYNLIADGRGAVWAGTGRGIHRITFSREGTPRAEAFGRAWGVQGTESNQRASLLMPDGSLWFGTTEGAVHYMPGALVAARRQPVSLVIQSVGTGGRDTLPADWYAGRSGPYSIPRGLRLPYRRASLAVRFRAVSLAGPDTLLYRYRLSRKPAVWSAWSTEEQVTFSALPPGSHRLLVQCSTDGHTPLLEASYDFSVETPLHRTPLFYFGIGALCMMAGIAVQHRAARRRRAREAALEAARRDERAKIRQRTAEDFHDEVGNTITRMTVLAGVLQSRVQDPDARRLIEGIRENASKLYSGTRDILWSLQPGADGLYEILNRIRDFGQDLFGDTDVQFVFGPADEAWQSYRLPLDWTRNLTMIFKEGMNNALKYAGARRVELAAQLDADAVLTITLRDDGRGFQPAETRTGHGLQNMQRRAGRLGGTLAVESAPGAGTALTLRAKIPPSVG